MSSTPVNLFQLFFIILKLSTLITGIFYAIDFKLNGKIDIWFLKFKMINYDDFSDTDFMYNLKYLIYGKKPK